jgi:hypothetical protein
VVHADIYSLPLGGELNTTLAILTRCRLEQMMMGKRSEKISVEQGMALVEVENPGSFVKDVKTEMDRMFALWDAVSNIPNMG